MKAEFKLSIASFLLLIVGGFLIVDDLLLHWLSETMLSPFVTLGFPFEHWFYGAALCTFGLLFSAPTLKKYVRSII